MASGRDGPIPYKAIGNNWKDFVDEDYFPSNIGLQDPSRYPTDDTNQILKLWREREEKGEIPFKFNFILGRNKELEICSYPDGVFDGLKTAGNYVHSNPLPERCGDSQDEGGEENESDDEPPLRKSRTALSDDEDEEELESGNGRKPTEYNVTEQDTDPGESDRNIPTRNRKQVIVSEEENEGPRETPLRGINPRVSKPSQPRPNSTSTYRGNSSPTLAGSSPVQSIREASYLPVKGRPRRQMALPTPEPSQPEIQPTPAGRELRPRNKGVPTVKKSQKGGK